ncbi:MAG TPA: ABC transporter ATP-binding protein [Firmicutes bacterium]|nr:ABC transporter ATP-binding protein [Bacillota bacterium]
MALIELKNIEFNYSDKELYRSINMKINEGEHCVLVGVNGSGKTTILNMLAKKIKPDKGEVIWTPHVTFSYLDQNLKINQDMLSIDYLHSVFSSLFEKEKEMENLYEKSAIDVDNFEKYLTKAQKLQDELVADGFYSLKDDIARLIAGLGLPSNCVNKPLSELSSGQREKVYLIKMLLEKNDVLIMDEPTNFLDANQVNWLAEYLNNYEKAFIVVSHDQEFLRKIASVVFSLENKTIVRYRGTFDYFLQQHEIDKEMYEKRYNAQQRYIKNEEDFIAKHIVRATSSKAAKSRRARLAHLERMDTPMKEEGVVHFVFPFTKDVGKEVLKIDALEIGYNDKPILPSLTCSIFKGQKIAILGKNGVGKTTFLKTILGIIPPINGSYHWINGVEINYFNQDANIDLSISPFDMIHNKYPELTNTEIRTLLGSFGLRKDLAIRKMKELSGGEVTKARFALLSMKKSNVLILDEPTNHLDQKAKDALFEAIERYAGVVIMVSHEKDFYDGLVDYEIHF